MSEKDIMLPFLKWPGGKRWLAQKIAKDIPCIDGKYIEPFLGGGAFFFFLNPKEAVLSDINIELIETYKVMRDNPAQLREKMLRHQKLHDEKYYYKVRASNPKTKVNRAARFLYLNRTCFNGMYRVNRKGEFNVPKGTRNVFSQDVELFETYAQILKNADIKSADFSEVIEDASAGDLIFADPPYAMSKGNQFVKYNDKLFTWHDQIRLFHCLQQAKKKGVHIILTNAFCEEIAKMYREEGFVVQEITRACSISGNASKRKKIKELLISTYEFNELENLVDE